MHAPSLERRSREQSQMRVGVVSLSMCMCMYTIAVNLRPSLPTRGRRFGRVSECVRVCVLNIVYAV